MNHSWDNPLWRSCDTYLENWSHKSSYTDT